MLINLTNHPSVAWTAEQIEAAKEYGEIVDMPFPQVNPESDEDEINNLANKYFREIIDNKEVDAVHLMGEMNFTFALVTKLKLRGITCIASTTKRETVEENGVKISKFKFVRFRRY